MTSKIEEKLLSGSDLVEQAIAKSVEMEIEQAQIPKKEVKITDIKKLKKEQVFDIKSVFTYFNRKTKQTGELNGIQANSFIGLDQETRANLMNGLTDNFLAKEFHIKFDHRTELV